MKIGIDCHNVEGNRTGVGRVVFNLLKNWAGEKRARFILYFKNETPADLPSSDAFECRLLNVGSTAKFMNWDLWRAVEKDKLDMLFCPDYRAPVFYSGKTAIILHDISYEARPKEFNWKSPADKILLKWASKRTSKRAKMIFAPSEYSKKEISRLYRIDPGRIIVAYLGVDEDLVFPEAGGIDEIKKKFGIEGEFILYIGSIFSRRHVADIIKAFSSLDRPGCQLLLGGKDYTEGKQIDKMARELNLKLGRRAVLRVDFIRDSDLKLLYSACAFFIWLSDYEGFGLPPLEAMANGAPVITSESSCLREIAGPAAILIKNNSDIGEIKSAMEKLFGDRSLRQDLIRKGRERAAKFSWRNCSEIILKSLLGN